MNIKRLFQEISIRSCGNRGTRTADKLLGASI